MEYKVIRSEEYLEHHGILGQKWGVRRFQNEDGSLTPEGEKRYGVNSSKKEPRYKETDKYKNLVSRYKQGGYSQEEAEKMASRRIITEKALLVTSGLTLAACAVYAGSKIIRDKTDQVIKAGDSLQRIEMQNTNGELYDVFYASKGKHDNTRYKNLLGNARKISTGEAYMLKLEAAKDVRVASKKEAIKQFSELYKNDMGFRNAAKDYSKHNMRFGNLANPDNMSDRNMKRLYENFNSHLVEMKDHGTDVNTKFFDKLKNAGYGAVQDINDMQFSGYAAKNPLIIFDNENKNIMVKSVSEIKNVTPIKNLIETGKANAETYFQKFGVYAGLAAAATSAKMVSDDKKYAQNQKTISTKAS